MNDDQFAFFQQLVESTGPSGFEQESQRIWRERVADVAESVETDSLGSSVAVLNSAGRPRVMIDGHIDEIGFIVKYIDDNGFLYFSTIGGFDPSSLPGNRVRIIGRNGPVIGVVGRKSAHLIDADERKKAPDLKSMWIDIGAANREDAEALVRLGDAGGRATGMTRLQGNLVASNSLDDRVGCYIMSETFRALADSGPRAAVYAASSVQEEIGLRGARVTAYTVEAEIGIALEVIWASDHPQVTKTEVGDFKVGGGPVITRGANTNPVIVQRLMDAADAEGVPYQIDAEPGGTGTDLNVMQMTRRGMAGGLISVVTRYLHSASEVCSLDDIDGTVTMLTRFVQDLEEGIDLRP